MSIFLGLSLGLNADNFVGANPLTLFGSALIQWWDATDASTVTLDTGAPATTISQIASKIAGGASLVTNAKANQPNALTTDFGGRTVVHHDTFSKNMYADFTFPTDMTIFTVYQLDAYATGVNNRRHVSCYVGTSNDYDGATRAVFHQQNAQLTSMRAFFNNVFLGSGYSLATGSYGTTTLVANDTGNTMDAYRNNSLVNTGAWTGTISNATRFGIGKESGAAAAQYSLVQRWPELFIINRTATVADRAAAESYFKGKYGI
jgi:hypothetical protein